MKWIFNDGGREAAIHDGHGDTIGFLKQMGDCATRAIAIATGIPIAREKYERRRKQPNHGIYNGLIQRYMTELGWKRTLCQQFGRENKMQFGDLPQKGRLVVVTTRHCCALINGVLHDTWNCATKPYIIHSFWMNKCL